MKNKENENLNEFLLSENKVYKDEIQNDCSIVKEYKIEEEVAPPIVY